MRFEEFATSNICLFRYFGIYCNMKFQLIIGKQQYKHASALLNYENEWILNKLHTIQKNSLRVGNTSQNITLHCSSYEQFYSWVWYECNFFLNNFINRNTYEMINKGKGRADIKYQVFMNVKILKLEIKISLNTRSLF